ncbi:MAG: hypothetical protein IJR86_07500 [Bacteroidaceae bacterium]|nr:hypothetical protein [Bacteroidaceae bacterium]
MRLHYAIATSLLLSAFTTLHAQTFKSLSKVQKAIVSLNTYDKNGDLLHSGTAFYTGKNGEAVADFAIFKGAYKASVIDMNGKKADIDCILGADDTYSIVKFKVATKGNAVLNTATAQCDNGTTIYAVPFSKEKVKTCKSSVIESATPVQEKYSYYTLIDDADSAQIGSPLFNGNGELIGILQPSIKGKGYALDIRFIDELKIKAISTSSANIALNAINIPKGLPDNLEEALVYAYFKSRSANNDEYMDIMNRFVSTYPDNAEGYLRRSTPLTDLCRFDEADADLNKYISLSTDKATAHYNVAQAVLNKLKYMPQPEYAKWTHDYANELIDKSIALFTASNDTAHIKTSKILKAQILTERKDYNDAINIYDELASMPGNNTPSIHYAKSQVCELRGDSIKDIIAILDSAIALFPTPHPREAANYVLRRGRLYNNIGMPRKAVLDYNEYCYLMNNQVSAIFYYDRSQIEMQAHMYQQAYEDITNAINGAPNNLDYKIEKAGMCLRFSYIDECIDLCNQALTVIPDDVTALRILGYAQLQKGNKETARTTLQRAIDLGDELSKDIMNKYFK